MYLSITAYSYLTPFLLTEFKASTSRRDSSAQKSHFRLHQNGRQHGRENHLPRAGASWRNRRDKFDDLLSDLISSPSFLCALKRVNCDFG